MRTYLSALTISTAAMLLLGLAPAAAKHRHHHVAAAPYRQDPAPQAQPMAPVAPSTGSAYRNHIVEGGMTQDQLDRSPGR